MVREIGLTLLLYFRIFIFCSSYLKTLLLGRIGWLWAFVCDLISLSYTHIFKSQKMNIKIVFFFLRTTWSLIFHCEMEIHTSEVGCYQIQFKEKAKFFKSNFPNSYSLKTMWTLIFHFERKYLGAKINPCQARKKNFYLCITFNYFGVN